MAGPTRFLLLLALVAAFAFTCCCASSDSSRSGGHGLAKQRMKKHSGRALKEPTKPGRPLTNAERFVVGLPPLKPKRLLDPTKVVRNEPSASPGPSASPQKRSAELPHTGIITVHRISDSSTIGYVSRSFTHSGQYTLTTDPDAALEVTFSDFGKFVDLRVTDPQDETMPYFGAIASETNVHPGDSLSIGSSNHAQLGFASKSASSVSSSPQQPVITPRKMETSIWSFEVAAQDTRISPTWINPDGRPVANTAVLYLPTSETFCLTGDVGAFEAAFESSGIPVEFHIMLGA